MHTGEDEAEPQADVAWAVPGVPFASAAGSGSVPGLVGEGLAGIDAGVDAVLTGLETGYSLTEEEVRNALVSLQRLANRVEAARLAAVRASLSREPAGAVRGKATRAILADRCRVGRGQARTDVVDAELTDPDTGVLRGFGAALAAGDITGRHLREARRAVARIPDRYLTQRRAEIDDLLTSQARAHAPESSAIIFAHLVQVLEPDQADRVDPHASLRRFLSLQLDAYGMTQLRGQLDRAGGDLVATVLEHLAALDQTEHAAQTPDGDPAPTPADTRTPAQRRADALATMAGLAAEHLALILDDDGHPASTGIGGQLNQRPARSVPHVSLHVTDHARPDNAQHRDAQHDGARHHDAQPAYARHDSAGHDSDHHGTTEADTAWERHSERRPDETAPEQAPLAWDDETGEWFPARRLSDEELAAFLEDCQLDLAQTTHTMLRPRGAVNDSTCKTGNLDHASTGDQAHTWTLRDSHDRPLPLSLARQYLCDAVLDLLTSTRTGRVVSLTSTARLATPAQQLALAARDGGCVFPGCAAPPRMCHAHHVQHWADGGPTTLDNLALLCARHHRDIHTTPAHPDDGWNLVMIDGLPHAVPPAWLDPARRPLRNTLRQAITGVTTAGLQLCAELQLSADLGP